MRLTLTVSTGSTSGGRVVTLACRAATLDEALAKIYANIEKIDFPGMQYRKDIGRRK